MHIDNETVKKIAHLSRLEFNEAAGEEMANKLSQIITWIDKLSEVDTENVQPLRHMSAEVNMFREDEVKGQIAHEKALLNAPKRDSDYFRVPKVIE